MTSNLERAGLAGNVMLSSTATGLPKDCVAIAVGLEVIDRSLLAAQAGRLPPVLLSDIDDGI